MKLRHLGYACTNVTLGCTTGRTLRLANLTEERAAAVIAENLATLQNVLSWNVSQDIRFFRVSSAVVPLASHEAFPVDWQMLFAPELAEIRRFVMDNGVRLSMHPGQYTVLNAPRPEVVRAPQRATPQTRGPFSATRVSSALATAPPSSQRTSTTRASRSPSSPSRTPATVGVPGSR